MGSLHCVFKVSIAEVTSGNLDMKSMTAHRSHVEFGLASMWSKEIKPDMSQKYNLYPGIS